MASTTCRYKSRLWFFSRFLRQFTIILAVSFALLGDASNRLHTSGEKNILPRFYVAAFVPSLTLGRSHVVVTTPTSISISVDSSRSMATGETVVSVSAEQNPYKLTPELLKIATAFEMIGDDKLRYKQLLYMANQLEPLNPASAIAENKVPGCLSTVFVDGFAKRDDDDDDDDAHGSIKIYFVGDSDGLLTKGLVALLVRGLSGNTATDIAAVDPTFIKPTGIAASLTPGRNNGFLNMMAIMKQKAFALEQAAIQRQDDHKRVSVIIGNDDNNNSDPSTTKDMLDENRPMYSAMMMALNKLQPISLELMDVSYQHEGHSGSRGINGESHFELDIVAPAFEGLSLVKRHQLIYMILGEIMPQIHALQIRARTPAEANMES